jgi:hypothetical protein
VQRSAAFLSDQQFLNRLLGNPHPIEDNSRGAAHDLCMEDTAALVARAVKRAGVRNVADVARVHPVIIRQLAFNGAAVIDDGADDRIRAAYGSC